MARFQWSAIELQGRKMGLAGRCYKIAAPANKLVLWDPKHGWRARGRPAASLVDVLAGLGGGRHQRLLRNLYPFSVSIAFLLFICFCVRILHFLELLLSYYFFFHAYLTIMRAINLREKHPGFCSYSSPGLLSRSFLGPPFLKKGPLKLQKGAHWALIGQFLG